ncbi:MAG TPA: regulatory signaling modulator protein AmpE [Steroidobacteraceae bacterium]|nr:regulatory signaling modulator protein AmpE [Steroidobacteraceae bacterium]
MNLVALILALIVERLTTRWLHLREAHWFDGYFEWSLGRVAKLRGARVVAIALVFTLLPVLPVAAVAVIFSEWLSGFAYVGFAMFVLIFSFGPRDLKEETDEYLAALARGDNERAQRAARALMEHDARQRMHAAPNTIEDAIFVQANNRVFGVAFWFLVAGPAGAWLFRVTDLMRRHAVMEHRDLFEREARGIDFVRAVQAIHGVLAWLPARLLAIGFALAGSFDDAFASWRAVVRDRLTGFFERNDEVLMHVGRGALGAIDSHRGSDHRCRAAVQLVWRAALIWLVGVSLLVLFGRIV